MLSRWFNKKDVPLTGAPAVRRQKTYSAQSGYVYQYFYQGQRPSSPNPGTEYVFDVSADRKTSAPASVFVSAEAVENWQSQTGRTLSNAERYAIAKMALFQAFDERATPDAMREVVRVTPAGVRAILETLNID
ncbi:MAG TPA: hypothetical protein VK335_17865 [Bryobacteraceae bacterium]|nr:hypothetical protein [Bryobacteraceae bacterium]